MAPGCSICRHKRVKEINSELLAGTPYSEVIDRFNLRVKKVAVCAHKQKHIPLAMTKAHDASQVVEATSLLSKVQELIAKCEYIASQAERGKQWRDCLLAAREIRNCISLLGTLSGALSGSTTNINILNASNAAGIPADVPEERIFAALAAVCDALVARGEPAVDRARKVIATKFRIEKLISIAWVSSSGDGRMSEESKRLLGNGKPN
jgi:hypothetical protein